MLTLQRGPPSVRFFMDLTLRCLEPQARQARANGASPQRKRHPQEREPSDAEGARGTECKDETG
jgi:hypothetical protein